MKKLFSISLILILLSVLLCACKTTDNSALIRDFMLRAQQEADLGNYITATSICEEGYAKTNDYRLLYNQSVYSALSGNFDEAIACCETGIKKHSNSASQFLTAKKDYLKQAGNEENLYNFALSLWNDNNNTSKEIIEILYNYNPDEWGVLFNALYPNSTEQ